MNKLRYSELESQRFGKEIFRGNLDVLDIDLLKDFYKQNNPDILIFRIPVAEQYKMHLLNGLGKDVINADTLVYYQTDLTKTTYNDVRNKDLVFINGNASHKGAFEELINQVFYNYQNHYFSNPLLDRKKIAEGYAEWAVNTLNSSDNLHLLALSDNIPIGFLTCSYNTEYADIILNGVLPEYQSKGVYTDMLRHVKKYIHNLQIPILKVSTQIQNFAVQKVWNRENLVLNSAYVTIHLNKK
ncbi:MAG: GNAT family N-acetyltransferase [Flavipsychrobacter sp.]|nr:GNAT family N-acetyltransferase [Flavipsychrobacter sp.]